MPYFNRCTVSFAQLTAEDALLIKVPKENSLQMDIYFYIESEEILQKLSFCPLSRRKGYYYALKLSDKIPGSQKTIENVAVANKLLRGDEASTLIEDNEVLKKIDTENKFNWQLRRFNTPGKNHVQQHLDNNRTHEIRNPHSSNTQIISAYKANFFRHLPPRFIDGDHTYQIVNQLIRIGLKNEHDLLFLFKSYRLISNIGNDRERIAFQYAVYVQLSRYMSSVLVTSTIMSLMIQLLYNGTTSLSLFSVFLNFYISSAQNYLELILSQNETPDPELIVNVFVHAILTLTTPTGIHAISKSIVSNAYEFLKSNIMFFGHQWINPHPIHYELPSDLVHLRR